MVQRRAARFVKGRYRMFESITQMLEQLTWIPLSKRRENSRLILFYKIINNLAVVPHSCLEKADVRTRKKHSQKFHHIGYNIDPYGQSFFPNSGVALPARPMRVKPKSGELKLYVISPGWRVELLLSFQFSIRYMFSFVYGMASSHGVLLCVRHDTHTLSDT